MIKSQPTKLLNSHLLTIAITAAISSNAIATEIEDVIVTGFKASVMKSIDAKRNADSVVDAISAEDMGKFPDENLADSLQRIPGVMISREAGEGSKVSIRGLGPEFNRVTLNGRTATAGTGDRSFSFEVLASELVSRIDVVKTPTASMDDGGVGGTVNIKMAQPLEHKGFKAGVSATAAYEELSDELGPRASGFASYSNDEGTWGVLGGIAYNHRKTRQDVITQGGPRPSALFTSKVGAPVLEYENVIPELTFDDRTRANYYGAVQWRPNDNLDIVADVLKTTFERDQMKYLIAIPPNRGGFVANDIIADPTTKVTTYVDVSNAFSNNNTRNEIFDNDLTIVSLNPKWTEDNLTLDLDISHSKASQEADFHNAIIDIPRNAANRVTFDWRDNARVPEVTMDFGALSADKFAGQIYRLGRHNIKEVTDTENAIQLDVNYELDGKFFTSVETGIKATSREFNRSKIDTGDVLYAMTPQFLAGQPNVLPVELGVEFPVDDYMSNESGNIQRSWAVFDPKALANHYSLYDQSLYPLTENLSDFGNVTEDVASTYFQGNFESETCGFMPSCQGNIGIRYVLTDQTSAGYNSTPTGSIEARPGDPTIVWGASTQDDQKRSYSEFLWAANISFDLADDLKLRLANAKVMSRPTINDLSPGFSSLNPPGRRISTGNPNLDPFVAVQYDASLEWYYSNASSLSGAVFYKDIESVFQTTETSQDYTVNFVEAGQPKTRTETYIITRPENSPSGGYIGGAEISLQHDLSDWVEGVGFLANYTYARSDIAISSATSLNSFSLPGLSKHTVNLSAYYENDALSARVSYNYRSSFLHQASGANPQFRGTFSQVDASFGYKFNDTWSASLEGINLTNTENHTYYNDNPDQTQKLEYTGRRILAGVRASF